MNKQISGQSWQLPRPEWGEARGQKWARIASASVFAFLLVIRSAANFAPIPLPTATAVGYSCPAIAPAASRKVKARLPSRICSDTGLTLIT
jgi:hypothetical protein